MKSTITIGLLVLILTGGCAMTPDCRRSSRLATEIGGFGLPAEADLHGVAPACRQAFTGAWHAAIEAYCQPEHGFEIGHSNGIYYGVCNNAEPFEHHYRLGRSIRSLERERERLTDRLAEIERGAGSTAGAETAPIRMRLRVIERDLPELKTLARIHGLMEPLDDRSVQ